MKRTNRHAQLESDKHSPGPRKEEASSDDGNLRSHTAMSFESPTQRLLICRITISANVLLCSSHAVLNSKICPFILLPCACHLVDYRATQDGTIDVQPSFS